MHLFKYDHLPLELHPVATGFYDLAKELIGQTPNTLLAENMMRELANVRDAALRSIILRVLD